MPLWDVTPSLPSFFRLYLLSAFACAAVPPPSLSWLSTRSPHRAHDQLHRACLWPQLHYLSNGKSVALFPKTNVSSKGKDDVNNPV